VVLNTVAGGTTLEFTPGRSPRTPVMDTRGEWVAVASWHFPGVGVHDARTGKRLRTVSDAGPGMLALSPDGASLVACMTSEYRVFDTQTWSVRFVSRRPAGGGLVGQAAFSPDGSVLAVADTPYTLLLLDAATGRRLATLRPPAEEFVQYFCFSRDGSRLAVSSATSNGIDVWDLREIRRGLAELGLDWDLPPYPPAPPFELGLPPTLPGLVIDRGTPPRP
jgi:WD40 repeat protein